MALVLKSWLDLISASSQEIKVMQDVRCLSAIGLVRMGMGVVLAGLGLLIIKPFIASLVWAIILSILCMPIRDWLLVRIPNQRDLLPLFIIVVVGALILGPMGWLFMRLQAEAALAYQFIASGIPVQALELLDRLAELPILGRVFKDLIHTIPTEAHDLINTFKEFIPVLGRGFGHLFTGLSDQLFQFLMTGLALYFFLRDGPHLVKVLREGMTPLVGSDLDVFFNIIASTVNAVSLGIMGSAMIQGLVATLGYSLFGLETPLLLGLLSAISSLLPLVGAFVIWGPLAFFLILQNQTGTALGLSLWGLLVVHPTDNILRPLVIGSMLQIPILVIVIGVIGGFLSLGLMGVFVGPCILAMLLHLWYGWIHHNDPQGLH